MKFIHEMQWVRTGTAGLNAGDDDAAACGGPAGADSEDHQHCTRIRQITFLGANLDVHSRNMTCSFVSPYGIAATTSRSTTHPNIARHTSKLVLGVCPSVTFAETKCRLYMG